MSTTKVPLLNDYKRDFVLRRIPQTLLGGINLKLSFKAPFYVYVFQLLLWLMPFVVGGIFTIAIEVGGLNSVVGSAIAGSLVGLFVLGLQIAHIILSRRNTPILANGDKSSNQQLKQLLAEEDEIFFDSCCSYTTFQFVVPPKKYWINSILHAILTALLCGIAVHYNLPSVYNNLYGFNTGATVILFIFSWITISIAEFPLLAGGVPPEVATFHFVDNWEITSISRMFHVILFYVFHIVQIYIPSFGVANQVLHILFLFLPFLWLSGVLPPIDSLIIWLMEQLLIFAFGASPVATDARLFISFFISGLLYIGAGFLGSVQSLILYCAAFGFLLSTDLNSLLIEGIVKVLEKCKVIRLPTKPLDKKPVISLLAFAWHCAMFAINMAVAALTVFYQSQFNPSLRLALQIFIIVLMVLCQTLGDLQKVYFFFRLIRNCIYPQSFSSVRGFKKRQKLLHILGFIYLGLITTLVPLLLVAYLSPYLVPSTSTLPSFVLALGTFHAFRMTWQRTRGALLNIVVICVINLITTYSPTTFPWYDLLGLGLQLILVDFLVDRTFRFLDNLWFALTLLVTSWTDKKQRRKSSMLLICVNIVFFPFVIGIAALSAVLAAPMLPIFTLPLFYIAFPRPSRFWPLSPGKASANVCSDTAYYQQMSDDLTRKLAKGAYMGTLHTFGSIGTDFPTYLVRSQDRTFWVQVVESGYGYISFYVKGLELQETSCHALEATRLDDACQFAFEKSDGRASVKRFNPYPFFSGVTPLDTVFVNGYSDAKNSLAGIIDQPVALQQIHKDFAKCLVWLLVHYECSNRKTKPIPSVGDDHISSSQSHAEDPTNTKPASTLNKTNPQKTKPVSPTYSLDSLDEILASRPQSRKSRQSAKANNSQKPRPKEGTTGSLGSLSSILGSEDGRGGNRGSAFPKIPGYVSDEEDWEAESTFSDSGFGLPAVDVSERKKTGNGKGAGISNGKQSNGGISAYPMSWMQFDISDQDLRRHNQLFDSSWYFHVTSVAERDTGEMMSSGVEDDSLLNDSRRLVAACYRIVNVLGVPGKDSSLLGASHMCKVFSGDIPWSPDLDWLRQQTDLYNIVIKAHRYAVKLMYDRAAMGSMDEAENEDFDETVTSLREYDAEWHVGMETNAEWADEASRGKLSLFTVTYDPDKVEYAARVLIRRQVEAHVTLLSSAVVRGLWANQSIELLYATNDDEERYSIQAHPALLRNLTVQAADPPLGYPVFSSPPIFERTLPVPIVKADHLLWR